MNRKLSILFAMLLAVTLLFTGCTKPTAETPVTPTDNYPNKVINVIIPTSAGGAMDRVVRAVTPIWSEHLGAKFNLSYYDGASGEVGYTHFMTSRSDGYTLLAGNIGPEVLMYVMQNPKYSMDDFTYFAAMDSDPVVFWVRKDSPYQTIQELVEAAKVSTISLGTSRYPHPATLGALLLAKETGAKFNIIPYGGGAAVRTAGLTGEVDAIISHLSSSLDFASDIKFLLMFNDTNNWKDISNNAPTAKEAFKLDLPAFGANRAWAVKNEFIEQYPERYALLVSSLKKTFADPRLIAELKKAGMDPSFFGLLDPAASQDLANNMLKIGKEYEQVLRGGGK